MDNLSRRMIGAHGTVYDPQPGLNVRVTKPNGQVFYLPLSDFYELVCTIEKEAHQKLIKDEVVRIQDSRPSDYLRAFIKL